MPAYDAYNPWGGKGGAGKGVKGAKGDAGRGANVKWNVGGNMTYATLPFSKHSFPPNVICNPTKKTS